MLPSGEVIPNFRGWHGSVPSNRHLLLPHLRGEHGVGGGEAGPEGAGGRGQTEALWTRDAGGVSQGWYLVFSWQHGSGTQVLKKAIKLEMEAWGHQI